MGLGVALTFFGCGRKSPNDYIPSYYGVRDGDVLSRWALLGPVEAIYDTDDAATFPVGQQSVVETQDEFKQLYVASLQEERSGTLRQGQSRPADPIVDFYKELNLKPSEDEASQLFYAACVISSPLGQNVVFEIAKKDWISVHINGSCVGIVKKWNAPAGPLCYIPLHLAAGKNFVLLKVYSKTRQAKFKIVVREGPQSRLTSSLDEYGGILSQQWYPSGVAPCFSSRTLDPDLIKEEVSDPTTGKVFHNPVFYRAGLRALEISTQGCILCSSRPARIDGARRLLWEIPEKW